MSVEQIIIVGAGPGGISTALQLKRYGISPLIFERAEIGGLLLNANLVENYPGFPSGIPGLTLVERFKKQLKQAQVQITFEEVTRLSYENGLIQAQTSQCTYQAYVAVIASGTKPRTFPDLCIPDELKERVLYEVYHLHGEKGKKIAISGAGDAAFDYALNLSRGNEIFLLNRDNETQCLPLLRQRASLNAHIHYRARTAIRKINPAKNGLILDCSSPEGNLSLDVDYLVGAIGREAQTVFVSDIILQAAHELEECGRLHWVGDVVNGIYRQTAIAAGQGILAAMKVYSTLKELSS